jgi:hypothetical protein
MVLTYAGMLDKPSVFNVFSLFVSVCYSMHERQPVVAVQIGVMAENSSHELEHASHGRPLRRMGMDVRTPRNRGSCGLQLLAL